MHIHALCFFPLLGSWEVELAARCSKVYYQCAINRRDWHQVRDRFQQAWADFGGELMKT